MTKGAEEGGKRRRQLIKADAATFKEGRGGWFFILNDIIAGGKSE